MVQSNCDSTSLVVLYTEMHWYLLRSSCRKMVRINVGPWFNPQFLKESVNVVFSIWHLPISCTASAQHNYLCSEVVNQAWGKLKEHREKCSPRLGACSVLVHSVSLCWHEEKDRNIWECLRKIKPLLLLRGMTPRAFLLVFSLMLAVVLNATLFFLAWLALNLIGSGWSHI